MTNALRNRPLWLWTIALVLVVILLALFRPWDRFGGGPLLPAVADQPERVARIELTRGPDRLVLAKRGGEWAVASAGDAPADRAAVEELLDRLGDLRIRADRLAASMQVRLADERGAALGQAGLSPDDIEAPDLAPHAWAKLTLPRIDPESVLTVDLIRPGEVLRFRRTDARARFTTVGMQPVDDARLRALVARLAALDPDGFVGGEDVNWAMARYIQLGTQDGLMISAQVVPAADGGAWVRINADAMPGSNKAVAGRAAAIKALKGYAFRLEPDEAAPLQSAGVAP